MSLAGTFLLYTVPFLALIFVVIVVHEWGHFWVARRLGIKVEAFSMGFGPELFGWTDRYGTRFKLCLLPLGGYVKMFGEGDATRDSSGQMRPLTATERKWSYGYRPVSHRAAVVAAGPLVNILFGTLLLVLFFYAGEVMPPASTIARVAPDSLAAAAGLMPEDKVVTVNGIEAEDSRIFARMLAETVDQELEIVVQRGDRLITLVAHGIAPDGVSKPLASFGLTTEGRLFLAANPLPAVKTGLIKAVEFAHRHFTALGEIATGARPMAELAGPVGIASVTADTFVSYGLLGLTILTALLSINVGLVNLLPIPVLDGGHLVFMAFEVLLGKPLSPRIIKVCSWGGLCVIAVLVLLVTGHDLFRLAV